MIQKKSTVTFDVNDLRVAAPCSVGWENMTGDERSRLCSECNLNVYNTAGMTRTEVQAMIANRENRICIRMFRRSDGTVITKDCPVGLRTYRKRVVRFAATAFAALLGMASISFGQKENKKPIDASKIKIERTISDIPQCELTGTITDANGAVIPGTKISIVRDGVVKELVESNSDGVYRISNLVPFDKYEVEIKSPFFKTVKINSLKIAIRERLTLDVTLHVDGDEIVGILIISDPIIETTSPSITTKITRRQIQNLPIRN